LEPGHRKFCVPAHADKHRQRQKRFRDALGRRSAGVISPSPGRPCKGAFPRNRWITVWLEPDIRDWLSQYGLSIADHVEILVATSRHAEHHTTAETLVYWAELIERYAKKGNTKAMEFAVELRTFADAAWHQFMNMRKYFQQLLRQLLQRKYVTVRLTTVAFLFHNVYRERLKHDFEVPRWDRFSAVFFCFDEWRPRGAFLKLSFVTLHRRLKWPTAANQGRNFCSAQG
jgi:hypothetical protein